MKHFAGDPLTVLTCTTPEEAEFTNAQAVPFLEHLLRQIRVDDASNAKSTSLKALLGHVDTLRSLFRDHANTMKLAFSILSVINPYVVAKVRGVARLENAGSSLRLVILILRGKCAKELQAIDEAIQ